MAKQTLPESVSIPFPKGGSFIIDAIDVPLLRGLTIRKCNNCPIIIGPPSIRLSRMLMGPKGAEVVDHINGDPLDNRRANLRLCSHAENMKNRKPNRNATNQFKGVESVSGKWRAVIKADGKRYHTGRFATQMEAARAYDDLARTLHGEFARLNFPD